MPTSKPTIASVLSQKSYNALLAYCEETELSQSKAVSMILAKVFELLYEDGKRVANLDDLTTVDKVVSKTENETIDLESLEFLLRHHIANMREIKDQNKGILHTLNEQRRTTENYTQEMRSFRADLLRFKTQLMESVQRTIRQEIQNLQHNLQQVLLPVRDSLQRLSRIFKV